ERTIVFLDDSATRDDAIRAGSGEDAYLAMWTVAYEDAFAAIPIAETLLSDPDPQRRYAAAHLLAEVNIGGASRALVVALGDDDLGVVNRALHAFQGQSLARVDAAAQRNLVDELEKLLDRLGPRKAELEPLLWPWTGGTLDPQTVAALLIRQGEGEPVERF